MEVCHSDPFKRTSCTRGDWQLRCHLLRWAMSFMQRPRFRQLPSTNDRARQKNKSPFTPVWGRILAKGLLHLGTLHEPDQDFLRTLLRSESLSIQSFLPFLLSWVLDLHCGLMVLLTYSCFLLFYSSLTFPWINLLRVWFHLGVWLAGVV